MNVSTTILLCAGSARRRIEITRGPGVSLPRLRCRTCNRIAYTCVRTTRAIVFARFRDPSGECASRAQRRGLCGMRAGMTSSSVLRRLWSRVFFRGRQKKLPFFYRNTFLGVSAFKRSKLHFAYSVVFMTSACFVFRCFSSTGYSTVFDVKCWKHNGSTDSIPKCITCILYVA